MDLKFRIAAITDEYSPSDPQKALDAMAETGMTGAELRLLWDKNILDLTDEQVDCAKKMCDARGMEIMSIASPLLKVVLPNTPPVAASLQQDAFNCKHTIEDQPRLTRRAFEIAHKTGARVIRVFSYWRSSEPEKCFDGIATALWDLGRQAEKEDLIIGLENEHACNIATGAEAAKALNAVNHPNVMLVWDPANALCAGENPFPEGYGLLPKNRIAHVHAKDCSMDGRKALWGPLGTRSLDWKGQIQAFQNDGYKGWISLETHWPGPSNDKFRASVICGWNLRGLVTV